MSFFNRITTTIILACLSCLSLSAGCGSSKISSVNGTVVQGNYNIVSSRARTTARSHLGSPVVVTNLSDEPSDDELNESSPTSPKTKGRRKAYRQTKQQRIEELKKLRATQITSINALIGKLDKAYTDDKFLTLLNNRIEIETIAIQAFTIGESTIDNELVFHQSMCERLTYAHFNLTKRKTPWLTVKQTLRQGCEDYRDSLSAEF